DDADAEEEEIDWSAENTFFKDRKSRFTTGFRICAVRGEAEIAKALDGLRAMTAEEEQMAFQEARRAKLEKMREDREREQSRKREAAERKVREAVSGKTVPGLVADMAAVPGTGFLIGRREVTQAEWFAVTGSPCMIPIDNLDFVAPDLPAICVSLDDCLGFLEKLNATPAAKEAGLVFRLPAPSEWTLACRAGTTGDYCKLPDGTEIGPDDLGRIAWFQDNSGKRPHPVGQKEPNAFGLFDMIGNVEEHTFVDILAEAGIAGFYGGSWMDSADHCMTPSGKSPSGHSVAGRAHRFTSKGFRLAASSSTDAPDVSKRAAPAKAGKKASSGRSGNQIPEKNAARAEKEAATAESERMKRSQRFTAQDAWEVMAVAELLSIAASEETDAARRSEAKALAAAAKDVRARAVALMKGSGTLPDFDENDLVSVKEAARGSARLDPAEALDLLRQTGALKDSCEAFFGTKDRPGADFSALLAKAFSRADKLKEALKSADFDWDEDIACREAVALLEARVTTLSSLPTNGVPEMLLVPFRKNLTRHLSALRDMSAILRKGPPDGIVAKGDFDDLDEPVSEAKQSFREAREMVKEFSGSVPTLRDVIEML
ncbi:MAG: formylglycine-generating enzyme family protein, partial [Kiritimatiellae bacterium]|nr:formylglycine-generating enzyme family protein [Kiritimatiellia bacterium]